mgnify:CR=1 FL=1
MTTHEEKLAQARERMVPVAGKLVMALGVMPAVSVLAGAIVGILLTELGEEKAAAYLRALADATEGLDIPTDNDDQAPPAGRLQ